VGGVDILVFLFLKIVSLHIGVSLMLEWDWGDVEVLYIPDRFSFSDDVLCECTLLVLVITCCLARVVCAFNVIQ
jgi:hypothetical protein